MQPHPASGAELVAACLAARSHPHIAAVALANTSARVAWALLAHEREYTADYARGLPSPVDQAIDTDCSRVGAGDRTEPRRVWDAYAAPYKSVTDLSQNEESAVRAIAPSAFEAR